MTYIDTISLSSCDNIDVFESIIGDNYGVFKEIHHEITKIDNSNIINVIGYKCDDNLRIDVIFDNEYTAENVMKCLVLSSKNIISSLDKSVISFLSF